MALKSIKTAPHDGRYILLFGPSGYIGTPLRCVVCKYDAEYRPLQPWVSYSGDSFEDGGDPATYWDDLPELPVTAYKPIIHCTCCGRQIVSDGRDDIHVAPGPFTHMGLGTYACKSCSRDLDENGLFPEER